MWHHTTQPLTFTLDVDDFGIKYFSKQDANDLVSPLQEKNSITIDWSGDMYLKLSINWQYDKGYVEVSMQDYIPKALVKFQYLHPHLPRHAPHAWTAPVYGQKTQYDTDKHATTKFQDISGIFLYYARLLTP